MTSAADCWNCDDGPHPDGAGGCTRYTPRPDWSVPTLPAPRWPDGAPATVDRSLEPVDFAKGPPKRIPHDPGA